MRRFKVNKEMRNILIGELIIFNYNLKRKSQLECIELKNKTKHLDITLVCVF